MEKQKIREEKKSQGIAVDSESDEDNPFAMYKYKEEQKCEKNLENSNTNSVVDALKPSTNETVTKEKEKENNEEIVKDNLNILEENIHAEPSTSKISNLSTDTNNKKHKSIKVVKKKKERIVKNKTTKKQKKKSTVKEDKFIRNDDGLNTESTLLTLDRINEDSVVNTEVDNLVNIVQDTSNITDDVETDKDSNTNVNTDETKMEIINDLVEDDPVDKKHKKLLKREAKMKELSEKLKSVAEEYVKANINQRQGIIISNT